MGLNNIARFLSGIGRNKEPSISSENNNYTSRPISEGNWIIIVLGIAISAIGFIGTIFYGSQFVKEELDSGASFPYTIPSPIKNVLPIDLEIVFVVIGVTGFGIFIYGYATRVDKPLDFYPI